MLAVVCDMCGQCWYFKENLELLPDSWLVLVTPKSSKCDREEVYHYCEDCRARVEEKRFEAFGE